MAAIDKLYLKDYFEYDQLLRWSLIYYPKLLIWFYDLHLTEDDVEKQRTEYVQKKLCRSQKEFYQCGNTYSIEEIMSKLRSDYERIGINYLNDETLREQAQQTIDDFKKSIRDWEIEYRFSVMSTPTWVDNKLKWICPLPFVREYLHKQCGVNPKHEWFYKLFWRGKKLFSY